MRPHPIGFVRRSGFLLLLSALSTGCSHPPPPPASPVVHSVKIHDPAECLQACAPWPVPDQPFSESKHKADDLIALIEQAKTAYNDCAAKLACIARFQAQQSDALAPPAGAAR